MRRGRKAAGPKLVEGLSGSDYAKKRLEVILQTISGEITIEEACDELQIGRTRFYDIRQTLLVDMVERLEPRPAGRPSEKQDKAKEVEVLEKKVSQLEKELKASEVRAELSTFLPRQRPKKKKR